jgi:prepilin peptidase CpaA
VTQLDAFTVSDVVLLLLVVTAVVLDFWCFKISNRLIAAGYLLAFAIRLAQGGVQGVLTVLWNISFPVIILYLFYRMRAIGAGDVKLFSMIGGFMNFHEVVWCIVVSFVIGAVFSLAKLLYYHNLLEGLKSGGSYLWGLMGGNLREYRPAGDTKQHVIHFSLAIFLGTIAVMVCGRSLG